MKTPADIRSVFDRAVELPSEARERFVRDTCAGDTESFDRVMALLRSDEQATYLMPTSASVSRSLLDSMSKTDTPDAAIGQYRLVRKIGEGGMGTVYLGVRADDTYKKTVAIKVMRKDRVSEEFDRRFKQERQVLASLDHPNIARIFDGGATGEGLPYYVMEYVDGKPLDEFCNHSKLGVADRLKLFQQVCGAVNYLHDNLIVHRDLKPSNILITVEGSVKLLDFGIAKIQSPGQSNQTMAVDGVQSRLMTPSYASPEQMAGDSATKASDVYSLGVILYELLTGRLPFRDSETSRLNARDGEPQKPSTNIREDLQHTRETTSQLKRRLAGDLDNVILMALKRIPSSRYATAKDFADDLQNYLDGKSVKARKDTVARRAVKLVRRKPLRASATLVIVMMLSFGLWQSVQAYTQRVRADAKEAEIARLIEVLNTRLGDWPPAAGAVPGKQYLSVDQQVGDLKQMGRILDRDFPSLLSLSPGKTPEREKLVHRTVSYLGEAEQRAQHNDKVVREVAHSYLSVAKLQSAPPDSRDQPGFGDSAAAISNYRNSGLLLMDLTQRDPGDAELQGELDTVRTRLTTFGATPLPGTAVQVQAAAVRTPEPAAPKAPTAAPAPPAPIALASPPPVVALPQPAPIPVSSLRVAPVAPPEPPRAQAPITITPPEPPRAQAPAPPLAQPRVQPTAPPPPPSPPVNPVSTSELNAAVERYGSIRGKVQSATTRFESYQIDLVRRRLPVEPNLLADVDRMTTNLQMARAALDQRDLASAKTGLDRADAYADRVLKFFGR